MLCVAHAFIWHSKLYCLKRSNLVDAAASAPSANRLTIFQPKRVWNKIKLGNTTASMHQFILPCPVLFFPLWAFVSRRLQLQRYPRIPTHTHIHTNEKKSRKVVSRQNFRVRDNIHSVPPFSLLLLLFQHLPHSDRLYGFYSLVFCCCFLSSRIDLWGELAFFTWIQCRNNAIGEWTRV